MIKHWTEYCVRSCPKFITRTHTHTHTQIQHLHNYQQSTIGHVS